MKLLAWCVLCASAFSASHEPSAQQSISHEQLIQKQEDFYRKIWDETINGCKCNEKEEKLVEDKYIKQQRHKHYKLSEDEYGKIAELAVKGNPKAQYVLGLDEYRKVRNKALCCIKFSERYCRLMLWAISGMCGKNQDSNRALWEYSGINWQKLPSDFDKMEEYIVQQIMKYLR